MLQPGECCLQRHEFISAAIFNVRFFSFIFFLFSQHLNFSSLSQLCIVCCPKLLLPLLLLLINSDSHTGSFLSRTHNNSSISRNETDGFPWRYLAIELPSPALISSTLALTLPCPEPWPSASICA